MAAKIKIQSKDMKLGQVALEKALKDMKGRCVVIGVTEPHGAKEHPGNPGRPGSHGGDASVADVAFWNEFGTTAKGGKQSIPPRPFLRMSFDENEELLKMKKENLVAQIMAGSITVQTALEALGFLMKNKVSEKILSAQEWAKALSARTIAAKQQGATMGAERPLIDSGLLLRSVDFEVKDSKDVETTKDDRKK